MGAATELTYASAREQAAAIASGRTTSRDLLESVLARVDALNPAVNAVVVRRDDAARALADAADRQVGDGRRLGPLHGVPITVKECFSVRGMATTAGAPEMADQVAEDDAVAVHRLVAAGAIIYGKTNTPYMAADLQTYNEVYGTTNNPWDAGRSPGGSSGGSAAAVAAGFSPVELGSDIGGSIRNPAHHTGVYGHKPSFGVVPLRGHVPGPPGQRSLADLAVAGPLASSAADLDVMLNVVSGPDEWDAPGWRLALPLSRRETLDAFRVGVLLDAPQSPVSSAVGDVLSDAVDRLVAAGVTVVDHLPDLDLETAHHYYLQLLYGQEATDYPRSVRMKFDVVFEDLDREDTSRRSMLIRGVSQRHRHWLAINERRHRLRLVWAKWFEDVDLLLCPVAPTPALLHDHSPIERRTVDVDGTPRDYWEALFWAGLATLPYLPATVMPAGLSPGGLPVGLQAIGPYLHDRTPMRFAHVVADVLGGMQRPPGY